MSDDKAALIKTAYSYYQKGDWDRAIEEYHKLAELDPKDLNVHNMLADIYAKKGDPQEALQQYDLVAQGFDQKNQVDKVLQVYKRMLKLVPNDPALSTAVKDLMEKYLTRAAELEDQDVEKAAEIYRSILKVEPNRVDATFQFAKLLNKKGQKFEAIEALMNLAANLDPETQTARLAEVLQFATELDPLNIEAREKLVDLFSKAGQMDVAIKNLQDLIEIHISKNDFEKAKMAAQKAIEMGDQNTFYHLGVIYFNQQKYPESRSAFEKFLKQQEAHVGALKYLALACLRLNQTADAVQVYLRILDIYFNENLLDEAKEVRQTIYDLDPENETVKRYTLDQQLVSTETVEEEVLPAGPSPEDVARMEEEQQQTLLLQAQAYVEKGFYEQAIDIYLDMLKRWSQLPEIRIRLQQVYALMARSMEPVEKPISSEEIKSELERELREQMRKELEQQTKAVEERHNEFERQHELDQLKLKQELESKMMEHVQRSKEDEFRERLSHEFDQKQQVLALERERLDREKSESYDRLKAEMEKNRASLEQKIREQIEQEMRERSEKETRLKQEIQLQNDQLQKEEKERKQYDSQKKEKEVSRAKINQEIHQGMERMRLEREKESHKSTAVSPPEIHKKDILIESVVTPPAGPSHESLDDPFIRQTLADIYAKQGLYLEALKIYERILNDEPNNE
ncbi:MAG TPA: tetratricopeptide repeat protein, partial [bacterium]